MSEILKKALSVTEGGAEHTDRQYGNGVESMKRTAEIATAITGENITPEIVCAVQISLKLARQSVAHKEDNLVDLCGYVSILSDVIADRRDVIADMRKNKPKVDFNED